MSPLIPLAIGAGVVYVVSKKSDASKASAVASSGGKASVDAGMDSQIAQAVHVAVTQEKDKATLTNFAAALKAAGYNNSADAVTARASSL
jgi:hypothetical protein